MLLTITTTHRPATDLGFLLAKHPEKLQSFRLGFGDAHVFYPEVSDQRCTAALLLDVDPIALVRGRRAGDPGAEDSYVNDRPYVASSLLSVAIAQVLGSAYGGRSRERPELAQTAIPLEANLSVVPCRGGPSLFERLFAPLGWSVRTRRIPLDPAFPEWGESDTYELSLSGTARLSELLSQLYVLVPVLDDDKHYWVDEDEVEKLVRKGEGWLATHPERQLVTQRYLRHRRHLVKDALARLATEEEASPEAELAAAAAEEAVERTVGLDTLRIETVVARLGAAGATSVLDLGCGEGKLLRALLADPRFTKIAGVDVSLRSLQIAEERLRFDRMPAPKRARIQLLHGSVVHRDARFAGWDAATLIEVIEHVDPPRLAALCASIFGAARPQLVLVTTPNVEYNARFERLPAGRLRHRDHRFEWTRAEFRAWAEGVASRHRYAVTFEGIGAPDPELGAPTQLASFTREGSA